MPIKPLLLMSFRIFAQLGESGIMKFKGGWKTITLDQSKLSTLNMWREDRYPGPLFVSDAFQQELKARKLNFFKLAKTGLDTNAISIVVFFGSIQKMEPCVLPITA